MTVKELIKELETCDPELPIILQKDAEGNGYSPLAGVDGEDSAYQADSTWNGEVGLRKLTPELEKQGYGEEDIMQGEPCVVLWPVN